MISTVILVALVAGSVAYSILSVVAAIRYLATPFPGLNSAEPVSILKPLAGLDDNLDSNLRTFFEQNYPVYEILFAVKYSGDPAAAVVERLRKDYPRIPARLIVTGESAYTNAKVFSLQHMLSAANHDLLVMSDSDTRVTPDLLRTVAAEFQDPKVAIATCPYRAVPGRNFWSRLEATGMNTDFIAGILTARMLEGMRFAVGPTIVARRAAIQSIGGFERLKDYLAEDFVMGQFAAEAGLGVILSTYVIEHHNGNSGLRQTSAHRTRWFRSTRRSRPWGYIGQLFTMPLPLSLLLFAIRPRWWPLVVAAILIRLIAAHVASWRILHAKIPWILLPLEDITSFLFWLAGFFGNNITWRGRRYRLHRDGKFELNGLS